MRGVEAIGKAASPGDVPFGIGWIVIDSLEREAKKNRDRGGPF